MVLHAGNDIGRANVDLVTMLLKFHLLGNLCHAHLQTKLPSKGTKVTFAKFSILNGYILHHIVHADLLICVVQ